MVEPNVAVARRAVERIWNQGELDLADALFASAYVNHGGLIPDLVRGPEAIKVSVALCRAAFPRLYITVEEVVASGDLVALSWTAHRSPPDRPASRVTSGTRDRLTGTTRCRLVGGQIVESWTAWDHAGVLERVGISPLPDSSRG